VPTSTAAPGPNFHSDKAKFLLRLNGTLSSRRSRVVILLGNGGNSPLRPDDVFADVG
jgi:hypothetical protein